MVYLPEEIHDRIKAHGVDSYPYEGCGVLLGRVENGANVVVDIRPLTNVWPNDDEKRVRFRIAEDDWRDSELMAMAAGLDIVGIFHSHPDSDPVASPRDLGWASWPGYSYIITEVRRGEARMSRSWQLFADRTGFSEEEIVTLG